MPPGVSVALGRVGSVVAVSIEDRLAVEQLVTEYAWTAGNRTYVHLVGEYEVEYMPTHGGWRCRRRPPVPID
jgi:hypothetical protein